MGLLKKYLTMFREDMREVMKRRCGLDELNNFIMLFGFVYIVIALFTKSKICILFATAFVVLCYMRVFSKNLEKRKKENDVYLRYMGGAVEFAGYGKLCIKMWIKSIRDKEYCYFVCSSCHQIIRLPKGKNKVSVRCPKCGQTFIKRT